MQKSPIFQPKNNQVKVDTTTVVVSYLENGNSDEQCAKFQGNLIAAQEVRIGPKVTYKVKAQRGGQLFNPMNKGFRYGLDKEDKLTHELMFKFHSVNKECFDLYLNFLKKRYDSMLIKAETKLREN